MRYPRSARAWFLAGFLVLVASGIDLSADEELPLVLEPANAYVQRVSRELNLTKTQQAEVAAIVEKADLELRRLLKARDAEIRALLNKDQQGMFDAAGASRSPGQNRRGGMMPMDGDQRPGMPAEMQGLPRFDPRGRGQMPGRRMGPMGERCGDGECDQMERARGVCPQDCGR